jgi:hypothetical protein
VRQLGIASLLVEGYFSDLLVVTPCCLDQHLPFLSPIPSTAFHLALPSPNLSNLEIFESDLGSYSDPAASTYNDDPWGSAKAVASSMVASTGSIVSDAISPLMGSLYGPDRDRRIEATSVENPRWVEELDNILVSVAPEKGGVLVKHVNYFVKSKVRKSVVLQIVSGLFISSSFLFKFFPPFFPDTQLHRYEALQRFPLAAGDFEQAVHFPSGLASSPQEDWR